MTKGLVRDAASAKVAAEINDLLRQCEAVMAEHVSRMDQGLLGGGLWVEALVWDLGGIRARLDRVRDLVNGTA